MARISGKKWAIGAVIMAGIGYLAGILTAPKSGKETREDIKETANRVVSEAEKELKKLHAEMSVAIEEVKSLVAKGSKRVTKDTHKALEVAKDKQTKIKDILSAIRDGGASEDPELKKAIKDAKASLVHLKKYMK